jgi:ABC-2 type transport system permease protein
MTSQAPINEQSPLPQTSPLYWSIRRELWENRSIYLAPLLVAAVVLFACFVSTVGLVNRMRAASALDPAQRHAAIMQPFSVAPAPIMATTFLVGIFYALEALYGERRDRSILFWKSLPVSDRTTVLAKASIPFVVLPLIGFALSYVTQLLLMLLSTAVLLAHGMSPAPLWAEFRLFQGPLVMIYGLAAHTLWFAPIYGWLLLISAWARRTPVLWAGLPLLAVAVLEKVIFNTTHFVALLKYRVVGAMTEAFAAEPNGNFGRFTQLEPLRFLSTPGLWIGLLVAAMLLAIAARLRRGREPI